MTGSTVPPLHSYDLQGSDEALAPLVLLHGLTFDRHQWQPLLRELATISPRRRVLAVDLPGHGGSPRWPDYDLDAVVAAVHATTVEVGLDAPVVVGHSIGGLLATLYAARYAARAVVNIDQPLLPGPFGAIVRQAEATLRGPAFLEVWQRQLDGMHVELLPADAQELVRTATTPRADLLLGYWAELLADEDDALAARRDRDVVDLHRRGVAYDYVTGTEPPPPYRRWLESALPGARTTVLPGSGHFPHLAHPAEVAEIVVTAAGR
ncbi:alpha/beta hydrolase [Cellulosimicrobium terreum]|nr:alpha/beta hydrolase [Cellulosimicrobium terreum]